MISNICSEFGCTPLEAVEQPLVLTLGIMELRAYARAKAAIDAAKNDADSPTGPMADRVWEVQLELNRRRNERRVTIKAKAAAKG